MINHQFKNILYIFVIWTLFIYVGYNVLTAAEASTDQQKLQKEMCIDYKAKWKDGECHFSKESMKNTDDQGDYEDDLWEAGLYDDYYKRTTSKEERDKIDKQNQDYLVEDEQNQKVVEDWKNTVEPVEDFQIPSTTTKYYNDEDREKQEKEIAEYNNEQADEVETNNDDVEEADSSEESESDEEEDESDNDDEEDSSESE